MKNINLFWEKKLTNTVESLKKHGFKAESASTIQQANETLLRIIPPDASIGIGGSVTIRELNIMGKLRERGNDVREHWGKGLSKEERLELRYQIHKADYFLASSNAVTETGEIINIDGTGDRISAMIFAVRKVILVVGRNKITSDLTTGLERARNVAAVINSSRVGLNTPCVTLGRCIDCNHADRGCNITTIIERRPWQTDFTIILVNEDIGY